MELRRCRSCKEYLPLSDFYKSKNDKPYNQCKKCQIENDRHKRKKELEQNCGSERVLLLPNQYTDIYQKECVFRIMEILGFKFNSNTNIWSKDGIKDENGNFLNLKKQKIIKGIKGVKIPQEIRDQVIHFYKLGHKQMYIGYKLGISDTSVSKFIKEYEKNKSRLS